MSSPSKNLKFKIFLCRQLAPAVLLLNTCGGEGTRTPACRIEGPQCAPCTRPHNLITKLPAKSSFCWMHPWNVRCYGSAIAESARVLARFVGTHGVPLLAEERRILIPWERGRPARLCGHAWRATTIIDTNFGPKKAKKPARKAGVERLIEPLHASGSPISQGGQLVLPERIRALRSGSVWRRALDG